MITYATKCRKCKKARGSHKAGSLNCPVGAKTRVGYTTFSKEVFDPVIPRNPKPERTL